MVAPSPLDDMAHVVQVSLTPVFLLSGVAALLNVFSTRLARVSDRVDLLIEREAQGVREPDYDLQLRRLRLRSTALDWAVVLGALAGAMSCGAILSLFLGALHLVPTEAAAHLLLAMFGGAVLATMGALGAYVTEMLFAGRRVRHAAIRSGLLGLHLRAGEPPRSFPPA